MEKRLNEICIDTITPFEFKESEPFEFKESEIVRSKILKFIVKVLDAKRH